MPTPPDLAAVKTYLTDAGLLGSWGDPAIQDALYAETAAQAAVCRLPVDPIPAEPEAYPADLDEALCNRVAHNLALRPLPLGVQPTATDSGVAVITVGGLSREIRRLEGPHRKMLIG